MPSALTPNNSQLGLGGLGLGTVPSSAPLIVNGSQLVVFNGQYLQVG